MQNVEVYGRPLSFLEFKNIYSTKQYKGFTYSSQNQPSFMESTISITSKFDKAVFISSPNTFCLVNDKGSLELRFAKHFYLHKFESYDEIIVTCKNPIVNAEQTYLIIAENNFKA